MKTPKVVQRLICGERMSLFVELQDKLSNFTECPVSTVGASSVSQTASTVPDIPSLDNWTEG